MDNNVFLIVLFASATHAIWNGMVKNHSDKAVAISGIVFGRLPLSIIAIILLPLPSVESIPYMIVSIIIHQGYQWFLLSSYEIGDLTKVYPIARGTGPLVATIISILFLGLVLDNLIILSILLICSGIIFLSSFDGPNQNNKILKYSLLTGLCIGLYSITDGYGARISSSATSFVSWTFIINALVYPLIISFKNQKNLINRVKQSGKKMFFVGGSLDYLTYIIVVWAFTKAPIPMVGALRETSILFSIIIGYFILKEKISTTKIFSILLILVGVIGLKFF
jgi:drug/metabolite transporter (DMT)-like permease